MGSTRRARVLLLVAAVAGVAALVVALGGWPGAPRDGTTTFADVADELPAGAVVNGATDVDSTVARRGESISAAVTYTADQPLDGVLAEIDEGLGDEWRRRSSSSDGATEQVIYDGPDEATLTVSARTSAGVTAVAAVLARG